MLSTDRGFAWARVWVGAGAVLGELRQCDSERGKAGAKKPDRDLVIPMAIELNGPGHGQWRIYSLFLSF